MMHRSVLAIAIAKFGPLWVTTGSYRIAALASGYVRSTGIITATNP
jgi:hypothetical protein